MIRLDGKDINAVSRMEARAPRDDEDFFRSLNCCRIFPPSRRLSWRFRPSRGTLTVLLPMRGRTRSRAAALENLAQVGLEDKKDTKVSALGQGERKQLELAVALAARPRLILLDEPLAGLSSLESQGMVSLLTSLKGKVTMLVVEHDMEAVFALADRISVLVYGRIIAQGTVEEIQKNEDVKVAYLGDGDV